ncbi:DUF4352 domain-containing protein [Pseudosporangium ferrugineum]|uniref:Uncharacterized protein DUF4352 n=1 Tax=Pseudosporangium ferrugineum TaxID=439699 RepID=A0A2T0RDK1_9ACTN|nr:DUF4352 domain-containing protein [Pseudosporangium ferrugineum]PRY19245.1 uncharacterized protein DUF4352 [Pseudosporangium ferrugineum]
MSYHRARKHGPGRRDPRELWPWIAGALAVLMIMGLIGLFAVIGVIANSVSANLGWSPGRATRQEAVAGRFNEAIADGAFRFAVTGVRCGARRLGTDALGQRARGEFCLVAVTVQNIGSRAKRLDGASQTAYAADGATYPSEVGAAMYAPHGSRVLARLDPGTRVSGTLVFDVPRGTRLTSVELRESVRTRGVRIPLR